MLINAWRRDIQVYPITPYWSAYVAFINCKHLKQTLENFKKVSICNLRETFLFWNWNLRFLWWVGVPHVAWSMCGVMGCRVSRRKRKWNLRIPCDFPPSPYSFIQREWVGFLLLKCHPLNEWKLWFDNISWKSEQEERPPIRAAAKYPMKWKHEWIVRTYTKRQAITEHMTMKRLLISQQIKKLSIE